MNAFFFRQPKFPTLFPEKATQYDKKIFYTFNPASISWKKYPERHNKFYGRLMINKFYIHSYHNLRQMAQTCKVVFHLPD